MGMIAEADAFKIFHVNINRTNMLIEAIDKIKAYNWLYQQRIAAEEHHFLQDVIRVQNTQLEDIGQTCAEQAIISLATVFETYCSELLQELLASNPDYFKKQTNIYSNKINDLLNDIKLHTYEEIEKKLGLQGRISYYRFYQSYNIPFITDGTEREFIEYIYAWRNHFVHNANRSDFKRDQLLITIKPPVKEASLVTEAKRLRTSMTKLITKIDMRVKANIFI